jgi:methionyl-tRNA formyltransferase
MSLIEPLHESQHEIVAILQDGRRTRGLRRTLDPWMARAVNSRMSPSAYALRQGLPLIWLDKMTPEELAPLAAAKPDILLVGGFGIIIKPPLLELPRIGCVNCHSSLLPKHRGPNPFAWCLLTGETRTGATFHVMDPGIDTGDILDQTAFDITKEDTTLSIYRRACDQTRMRVVDVMDQVERDGLRGTPQDATLATYEKAPTAKEALLDWRKPAEELDRIVRALMPSPAPRFQHKGQTVYVFRLYPCEKPVDAPPGVVLSRHAGVTVATGAGSVRITAAFLKRPFPWLWPAPWHAPQVGEQLPLPEEEA